MLTCLAKTGLVGVRIVFSDYKSDHFLLRLDGQGLYKKNPVLAFSIKVFVA